MILMPDGHWVSRYEEPEHVAWALRMNAAKSVFDGRMTHRAARLPGALHGRSFAE